ncbi:hypothetical protein BJX99DRAFT_256112 [Aspergillus californicus]
MATHQQQMAALKAAFRKITQDRQPPPHPDPRQTVLDILRSKPNNEILEVMDKNPEMAGFILYDYFMGDQGLEDAALLLPAPANVTESHRNYYKLYQINTKRETMEANLTAAREAGDAQEDGRLGTHRKMMQTATAASWAAMPGAVRRTLAHRWNHAYRAQILTGLGAQRERYQEEIRRLRRVISAGEALYTRDDPLPDLPLPLSVADRQRTLPPTIFCPIESLIERNFLAALQALTQMGLFDPMGYTRNGETYLHLAMVSRAHAVADYISSNSLSYASPGGYWGLSTVGHIHPDPAEVDHLRAAMANRYPGFCRMWETAVLSRNHIGGNMHMINTIFNQNDHEWLCTVATGGFARLLVDAGDINLAHIPVSANNAWSSGGSAWHLAIANPNKSFFTFLAEHILNRLQDLNTLHEDALDLAIQRDRYIAAKSLLRYNHTVTTVRARICLSSLPLATDRMFLLLLKGVGAELNVQRWLHEVVAALDRKVRQTPGDRAFWIDRAKQLIVRIRQRAGPGRALLAPKDMQNRNVAQLIVSKGFPELLGTLRPLNALSRLRYDLRPAQ